jgi:SLBB domain-containing protein/polysaccharide biosynthesis/export protein
MLLKLPLQAFVVGCLSAVLSTGGLAVAQSSAVESHQNFETRAQLETQLKAAEAKGQKSDAWLMRYRLEHGDFQNGDRIAVRIIRGAAGFSDTVVLRDNKKLLLPQLGEISLEGVLRSELEAKLTEHLSKLVRDPAVRATQLVRVGILGNVVRPGFYYVPADLPISDVLMMSGGPTPIADLDRASVRRNGDVIIDEKNTRVALSNGISLDLLHMLAGDEISVGKQKQFPWGLILPVVTTVIGLGIAYGTR